MNCKQGDLAIVVRSCAGNEGKIVRCLRFIGKVKGFAGDNRWETDTPLITNKGNYSATVKDAWVRPILDQDGEDEMLRLAGKPEGIAA